MAKLEIRITWVAWRGGRPRFVPGPDLRRLGFAGEDLKHPDGRWMSAAEAHDWADAKGRAIAAAKAAAIAARAAGRRPRRTPASPLGGRYVSTEELIEAWFRDNPRMRQLADGGRAPGALAPSSIKSYRWFQTVLGRVDADIYTGPVEALTAPICFDLYERVWQSLGLATARGVIATLSAAISWGTRKGRVRFATNPCARLGMQRLRPRVRMLSPDEIRVLVATADRLGRPEIGDAIILGVWTGQRQGDRLALVDQGLVEGRRVFRQSKTGAIVAIREAPQLEARLAAARERRAAWPVQSMHILLDERRRIPWTGDHYTKTFAKVRAEAAKTLPSIATATDQDLRDTAVTWLARAGSTLFEICGVTGHEQDTAAKILRHYLAQHPELSDKAIAKMIDWFDQQPSDG